MTPRAALLSPSPALALHDCDKVGDDVVELLRLGEELLALLLHRHRLVQLLGRKHVHPIPVCRDAVFRERLHRPDLGRGAAWDVGLVVAEETGGHVVLVRTYE